MKRSLHNIESQRWLIALVEPIHPLLFLVVISLRIPWAGAEAFKHDVPDSEVHLLETGHFALEEDGAVIAELIIRFLTTHLPA